MRKWLWVVLCCAVLCCVPRQCRDDTRQQAAGLIVQHVHFGLAPVRVGGAGVWEEVRGGGGLGWVGSRVPGRGRGRGRLTRTAAGLSGLWGTSCVGWATGVAVFAGDGALLRQA